MAPQTKTRCPSSQCHAPAGPRHLPSWRCHSGTGSPSELLQQIQCTARQLQLAPQEAASDGRFSEKVSAIRFAEKSSGHVSGTYSGSGESRSECEGDSGKVDHICASALVVVKDQRKHRNGSTDDLIKKKVGRPCKDFPVITVAEYHHAKKYPSTHATCGEAVQAAVLPWTE